MFPLKKVVSQRFTVYPKKNVVFEPWVLTNVCQHWDMLSKTTMFIHLLHHPQRHSFSITKMPVFSLFFLHHLMLFKQKKLVCFCHGFFPGNICYFFPLVPIVFKISLWSFPCFSPTNPAFSHGKMADLSHRWRRALTGQRCSSLPQSLAAELSPPFDPVTKVTN